ncbi:MAG: hypothetical protein JXR81_03295 [Candidatus Goldbacteria bacterium]|nr:hypothetical protein [Candidatus Goldiibacteriota bacterium]
MSELSGGEINALMVYTHDGRELVKRGVEITPLIAEKLKEQRISFIYTESPVKVSEIYERNIIAGLQKVVNCFVETGGNSAEILKRYNDADIKIFLSTNNELGRAIAYGHILKFYAEKMYAMLCGKSDIIYDFIDYRGKENYFVFHMVNTCCMCMAAAKNFGMDKSAVIDLGIGTMLYDYQMKNMTFSLKNSVLKPGEMEKIQEHTEKAYEYLRSVYGMPSSSSAIALQHHERYNGTGYPKKLSGDNILILSRIASVCDVYDSMVTERFHRPAYNPEEVWDYIKMNSGVIFDPEITAVFLRTIPRYMPGDTVELICGKYGVVAENHFERPENPDIILIEKTGENDIIGMKTEKKSGTVAAEGNFQIIRTAGRIR